MSQTTSVDGLELLKGSTLISCPGKVLLVGGYLVLDPHQQGLVITTQARFYCWVIPTSNLSQLNLNFNPLTSQPKFNIRVHATQFMNPPWYYHFDDQDQVEFNLKESSNFNANHTNKFVWSALDTAYRYLRLNFKDDPKGLKALLEPVELLLFADNDFYSQRRQLSQRGLQLSCEGLSQLPKFVRMGGRLEDAHKTGLGSSACLVTSVVGALLRHFLPQPNPLGTLEAIHRLSQYAHCRAQGKVGSGFDVAAAVYGSHLYQRFTPSLLSELFVQDGFGFDNGKFLQRMRVDAWDHTVTPVRLPPFFHMVLGEVNAGSTTPTLVSQVLKFRAAEPDKAQKLWHTLSGANSKVIASFTSLSQFYASDAASYRDALDLWASTKLNQASQPPEPPNAVYRTLADLATSFQLVRQGFRELSAAAAPIEPPEQTALLDALQAIPGVVMAGVPGAGGYDAVFVVYVDPSPSGPLPAPLTQIQACFRRMSNTTFSVGPLLTQEDGGAGLRPEGLNSSAAEAGYALLSGSQA